MSWNYTELQLNPRTMQVDITQDNRSGFYPFSERHKPGNWTIVHDPGPDAKLVIWTRRDKDGWPSSVGKPMIAYLIFWKPS